MNLSAPECCAELCNVVLPNAGKLSAFMANRLDGDSTMPDADGQFSERQRQAATSHSWLLAYCDKQPRDCVKTWTRRGDDR
jgi:hypothetical protein